MAGKKRKKKDFFKTFDYSSLEKTEPVCKHFGSCGGCRFQNISYASQIMVKEQYLEHLFKKPVEVVAAPSPYYYRNRMDFIYVQGKLSLRKTFDTIIPIEECHLIPPYFLELFQKTQELLANYQFPHYDLEEQKGFLRYITFRYAPTTKQSMLIATSTTPQDPALETRFKEFLSKLTSLADSVYWFINDTLTDVSIPPTEPVWQGGSPTIKEIILEKSLEYGPHSFFQSNTAMAEHVFSIMKEFVSGNTMDICCGVGAITLGLEKQANSMLGIELVSQAIEQAQKNAKRNNSKALFFTADMKHLKDYAPLEVDTIILDPPRAGVGKKPLKRILELEPKTIVYLSCNPKTQNSDLALIEELGGKYEIIYHKAFDFFPQTPHVESLVVLKKI